jgi:hypothetical protein
LRRGNGYPPSSVSEWPSCDPIEACREESYLSKYLQTALTLGCLTVIGLSVASYWGAKFVMDDALMFVRYAHNWTSTGTVSWNPADGPAYGATSLAFLTLVTVVSVILPSTPYVMTQVASCGCGLLFLCATAFTVYREIEKPHRSLVLLLVIAGLAGGATFLAAQFMTGMDTTLAMFTVSCLLMIWRSENTIDPNIVGVLGAVAFLVRPDLVLVTVGVPGLIALSGDPQRRPFWRRVILTTAITLVGLFVLLTLYFGTPVPLATFAKIFSPYGPDFRAVYRSMPIKQSINLVGAYWMLFSVAAGLLILNAKDLVDREHRLTLALLIAVTGWFLYLLGVTQIMAYRGRFYHPVVVPCVIYLVVWGCKRTVVNWRTWLENAPTQLGLSIVVVLAASTLPQAVSVLNELRFHVREGFVGQLEVDKTYKQFWSDFWYRLPEVTSVSPDLVIATTEVGLPGILQPEGTIIDLAGLNDSEIAMNGFEASSFLSNRQPDVIYMPHPHYVRLNQSLLESERFKQQYDFYSAAELGTEMDMALRREGTHYVALASLMPVRAVR